MAWVNGSLVNQIYFDSRDADLNQSRYDWLHLHRSAFETALGQQPSWDAMSGRKGARIVVTSTFDDLSATERWPEMIAWLIEQQIRFRRALTAVGGVDALREISPL
jgi:hypothetical protein